MSPYARPDTAADVLETYDPVLTAVRRARMRHPLRQDKRALLIALDAEAVSDPSTWQSFDGLLAEVAALAPAE